MSPSNATANLRSFRSADLELLGRWLLEPHVSPWYAQPAEDLAWAANPPDGGAQAIIESGGLDVGYLRWQRVDRETLDALGLLDIPENSMDADIVVSSEGIGRGVGPAALTALARDLERDPTIPMIGLTTELANTRAHRAFERAGFRKDRRYEAPPRGICHLMVLRLRPE